THSLMGGEGQIYLGNTTLYAQGGYLSRISGSDESEPKHLWFARGVGRYFFTLNDKVQAEIGYPRGPAFHCSAACTAKIITWGALYEHKFSGPFAVYAEYSGFDYRMDPTFSPAREHMFMIGGKVYIGQDTLQRNDRNGTTLDMPKFIRALAWSERV